MKVVLAGAFGNLGAEILKALCANGHEVVAADLRETAVEGCEGKYTFKAIDATNPETMKGLCDGADVVMGLRIQLERQQSGNFPSLNEYADFYGIDEKYLAYAKPNAIVMHPGPVNRGVELTSPVIDHENSRIEDQVFSGIAVRMALLKLLNEYRKSVK